MSYAELAKNPNLKKTLFMIIEYYDTSDTTSKKLYLSDNYFVGLTNGTTGTTQPYEPRLHKIPFFEQEIDPITNEVLIKSSYKVDILNNDDYYKDILDVALFKNQKVSIYSYVDTLAVADSLLLATASIKDMSGDDDYLTLELEDLFYYNKSNGANMSKFTDSDGLVTADTKDKYKPVWLGKVNGHKGININEVEDFKQLESIEATLLVADGGNQITLGSEEQANKFRNIVKIGDSIKLDTTTDRVNDDNIYKVLGYPHDSNSKVILDGLVATSDISTAFDILFETKNSVHQNNKIFVSKQKTLDHVIINGTGTAGNNYLSISGGQDLSFIKSGDRIQIERTNDYETEEYVVHPDAFDSATNRLYFIGNLYQDITGSDDVKYHYINKIKVKGQEFERGRRDITISVGSHTDISAGSEQKSYVEHDRLKISSKAFTGAGGDGVIVRLEAIQGSCSGHSSTQTPTNQDACEFNGGTWTGQSITFTKNSSTDFTIKYEANKHTNQDILDAYNALAGADAFKTDILIEEGLGFYEKQATEGVKTLDGGGISKSFIQFQYRGASVTDTSYFPQNLMIYFTKDGYNTGTAPSRFNNTPTISLEVAVTTGDSATTIATAIKTALDSLSLLSLTAPFFYIKNGNQFKIRAALKDNIVPNFTASIGSSWNVTPSKTFMDVFSTEIVNTDELILNLDLKALAVAPQLSREVETFNDISNSFDFKILGGAGTSGTIEERRIQFFTDVPEDLDEGMLLFKPLIDEAFAKAYLDTFRVITIDKDNKYITVADVIDDFNDNDFSGYILYYQEDLEIDTDDVLIYYSDEKTHLGDVIDELNDLYELTDFNSTDLTTLKTDYPEFITYLIIEKIEPYFKVLNKLLASFSLSSYIDSSGDIRYKILDILNLGSATDISYSDYYKEETEYQEFQYNKVKVLYNENFEEDSFDTEEITDSGIDAILSTVLNDFENEEEIESHIIDDIFDTTYNGNAFKDILGARYFKNMKTLKITGKEYLLGFNLLDVVSIQDSPKIDSSKKWIVIKRKTNGKDVKIDLVHFSSAT